MLRRTFDLDVFACVKRGGRLEGVGVQRLNHYHARPEARGPLLRLVPGWEEFRSHRASWLPAPQNPGTRQELSSLRAQLKRSEARMDEHVKAPCDGRVERGTHTELMARGGEIPVLVYANGIEGVGRSISDVGWGLGEPSEATCGMVVREHLARNGTSTEVLDWAPGDVARFERRALTLTRPAPLRGGGDC